MLSVGIVGLPNVGKSTLFKALTKKQIDIANFPFCTIEPNHGIVEVPDNRLQQLAKASNSAKIISTAIEFIDIAGLVKGANKGEGLGNQFLASIGECDMIVQVIRAFKDEKIIHVDGQPDPKRDAEIIGLELILKDLDSLQKSLPKIEKRAKRGEKEAQIELELARKLIELLQKGSPASDYKPTEKESASLKSLHLLSFKPILYLVNTSSDKENLDFSGENYTILEIDTKLEDELSEVSANEASELRNSLSRSKNSLDELISVCYSILELETFFTSGEKETRAWTIKKGTKAPQAAGKIHTDFEKGFIKADVINWQQLVTNGSWATAREKGFIKTEGKQYVVQDGDVIIFKFN